MNGTSPSRSLRFKFHNGKVLIFSSFAAGILAALLVPSGAATALIESPYTSSMEGEMRAGIHNASVDLSIHRYEFSDIGHAELDQMSNEGLESILFNPQAAPSTRNDIADIIRGRDADRFIAIAQSIYNNTSESLTFRSWIIQHLGIVLEDYHLRGKSTKVIEGFLLGVLKAHSPGSECWREAFFALANLPTMSIRTQLDSVVDSLTPEQFAYNADIIAEFRNSLNTQR